MLKKCKACVLLMTLGKQEEEFLNFCPKLNRPIVLKDVKECCGLKFTPGNGKGWSK